MNQAELKAFLDEQVEVYNRPRFIHDDPISIPHRFTRKQDIEIAAFFAAILAWGQRSTIISKCLELIQLMDNAPHDFILNHQKRDLKIFDRFVHRTFNSIDCKYFIRFIKAHYTQSDTLATAFIVEKESEDVRAALINFYNYFFSLENHPHRTRKHIATPDRNSACKRINMFLRWMVRKDKNGVDFGLWRNIKPSQLICPCDVHVERVARQLNLIARRQMDWTTAVELTTSLRAFDPIDPVKYDFALFGLGSNHMF